MLLICSEVVLLSDVFILLSETCCNEQDFWFLFLFVPVLVLHFLCIEHFLSLYVHVCLPFRVVVDMIQLLWKHLLILPANVHTESDEPGKSSRYVPCIFRPSVLRWAEQTTPFIDIFTATPHSACLFACLAAGQLTSLPHSAGDAGPRVASGASVVSIVLSNRSALWGL